MGLYRDYRVYMGGIYMGINGNENGNYYNGGI